MNNISNYFSTAHKAEVNRADPVPLAPGPGVLQNLPEELLLKIFKENVGVWNPLSRTSKFFQQQLASPIFLASLVEEEFVPEGKLLEVAKAAGIFLTQFCSGLDHLNYTSISDQEITQLFKACPNIQKLRLGECPNLTNATLNNLPQNLQSLNLQNWFKTGATLNNLPQNLQSLALINWRYLTGTAMDKLPQNLQSFYVFNNRGVSCSTQLIDEVIGKLPKTLLSLKLRNCTLSDEVIDKLPKTLQVLNLKDCNGLSAEGRQKISERFSSTRHCF